MNTTHLTVQQMDWQPIETAPKDGTRILAWRKHCTYPLIVRYDSDFSEFVDEDGVHVYHLSHWMPLPPPPLQHTGAHHAPPHHPLALAHPPSA